MTLQSFLVPFVPFVTTFILIYLYLLHRRLTIPTKHLGAVPLPPYSTWPSISDHKHLTISSILSTFPSISSPTSKRYLVLGGCGFIGSWIVRCLLERGEKCVMVWDLRGLPEDLRGKVAFEKVDLRSAEGIDRLAKKLDKEGGVDVVYDTVALMRFWERTEISVGERDTLEK
jgi:threonine dehydrogenase-like Zn-dependent dehydrogenase